MSKNFSALEYFEFQFNDKVIITGARLSIKLTKLYCDKQLASERSAKFPIFSSQLNSMLKITWKNK